MIAFHSYQTKDKDIAGRVSVVLKGMGIESFMAHQHIEVSAEWRDAILLNIEKCEFFVAILSKSYYQSYWCIQESGIAAFRRMTVIPLSIDDSIPHGFISNFQSIKIDPERPTRNDLLPSIFRRDKSFALKFLIDDLEASRSYRTAESNFQTLMPYLDRADPKDLRRLLIVANSNKQICHAGLCATELLPPLVAAHGDLIPPDTLKELNETLKLYQKEA